MENATEQKNPSLNGKGSCTSLTLDLPHPGLLILSLFSISCCCPCSPFAYASLYYVFKTGSYEKAGDIENATKSSYYAKLWAIVNIGMSLILYLLYFIFALLLEVSGDGA